MYVAMSLPRPSDQVLVDALSRALASLADQRQQLAELRGLSRLDRSGTRVKTEPDESMTAACMEALYGETLDFSVAGLTEVIEDLSRALDESPGARASTPVTAGVETRPSASRAPASRANASSTPRVHLRVVEL